MPLTASVLDYIEQCHAPGATLITTRRRHSHRMRVVRHGINGYFMSMVRSQSYANRMAVIRSRIGGDRVTVRTCNVGVLGPIYRSTTPKVTTIQISQTHRKAVPVIAINGGSTTMRVTACFTNGSLMPVPTCCCSTCLMVVPTRC